MNAPRVSVLTTVYNRSAYVRETLESILASTFTDFELIVVDDASTDDSWNVVQTFARDPRVRLFRNTKNLGDYPNRNHAASLARAPLLKYVDADDRLRPHALTTMVEAMEAHPDAAVGISLEPRPGLDASTLPRQLTSADAYRAQYGNSALFDRSPLSAILRRESFEAAGRFLPASIFADWDLWHRLAAASPVLVLPPELSFYRRHDGQESVAVRRDPERWAEYFRLGLSHLSASSCPLPPPEAAQARRFWQRRIARWILRGMLGGNFARRQTARREFGWNLARTVRHAFARHAAPLDSPLPPWRGAD